MYEYTKGSETINAAQFRVRHPNAVFVGKFPPIGLAAAFGYTRSRVVVSEPTYSTYEIARATVVTWVDGLTSQVTNRYPKAVQDRWLIEEAAARAVLADAAEPDPEKHIATADQIAMMTDEGAAKSRTMVEHATVVETNADAYRAIVKEVNKLFLATDEALKAVDPETPDQFEVVIDAALAQAAPLAAQFGLEVG